VIWRHRARLLRAALLTVVAAALLLFLSPHPSAGAADTSTRWESFSEASSCGEPYTQPPRMSKTGVISGTEPILGPFGTYFGRTISQVRVNLVYWIVPFSGGRRVLVHRAALPAFQDVAGRLADEAASGRVYQVTTVSSFLGRTVAGSSQLSRHALGTAIDINYPQNPYRADGTLVTNLPDWFVQVWRDAGFCWGGDWSGAKDPMHFSWMGPRATPDGDDSISPRSPVTVKRNFGVIGAGRSTVFSPVLARYAFAVADATGNGAPDVVGLRSHPTGAVIDIASGSRGYGFCSVQRWHIPDASVLGSDHTLFMDVDGDSRQDLVALSVGSNVSARVATRRGGFEDVITRETSLSSDVVGVAGADYDGDHRADLWAVTSDGTLGVYRGDGWTEVVHTGSLPSGVPNRVAVADRDGGDLPEIFALYQESGGSRIEVLRASGNNWAVEQSFTIDHPTASILTLAAGDYDGDGRADVQILDDLGRLEVYIGNTTTGRPAESWFLLEDIDCDDPVLLLFDGRFFDDETSVHRKGIEWMAGQGITAGCNPPFNDRFCPGGVLTRAQAATFVARALELGPPSRDHFVDDEGHVLEGGINRVAEIGITAGCNPPDNDRFCPDRRMTRAEFAAFIVRALGLPASEVDHFSDDDGHILERAINRLAEAGITQGCNPPANTHFCPQGMLTRAETATFMIRALD